MPISALVTFLWTALLFLVHLAVVARVILRPHREPASRMAWAVVILVMPVLGMIAYFLVGETNIGRRRVARMREVLAGMPAPTPLGSDAEWLRPVLSEPVGSEDRNHLFRLGRTVNGFDPVGGNTGKLLPDSNATIAAMTADIDAATRHVHLIFYIWLTDENGLAMVRALQRAAARGVTCRVMADGLGSRKMIASTYWAKMHQAGIKLAVALPLSNPLLTPVRGRIDLRNHRKILVVDNHITYCGSQNCADPEFRVKAKFAPWVDTMIRFEGPIARQNQHVFASDWMAHVDENLDELLREPLHEGEPGFAAQVIATGPTVRFSAMPEMFETLMYAARKELFITTPYYVPDESMQAALCAAGRRGIKTTIIFPARNDSFVVGAASRSYYAELLAAGVRIFEYEAGLLHAKTLTLDGNWSLIGSANLDRRSFELNYENNILLNDQNLTSDLHSRQESFLRQSHEVTAEMVATWSVRRRFWNNSIAMLGPVL
ncbi:cardiolipin synthase [Stratiformator vulcanicus]|uniref:Cardiolipin synthase n=1 Tax=Stratiformator vulcanicus TaxID=2527980 RepID=A0A517QYB1_9PLAN|nr:cardiolipin synthase [Stratiformator vulcanicus]QDT36583.1 Cardiolipin synthase [Stratiformator vulcanicus]